MTTPEAVATPAWERVLACLSPLGALVTLVVGMRWAVSGSPIVRDAVAALGITILALALSALWLGRAVFFIRRVRVAFAVAILLVLGVWAWQRAAYLFFIPDRFLQYGYFQSPQGRLAGLLILKIPFWTVTVGLLASLTFAARVAWSDGRRWSLISMVAWWFVLFVVFGITALYLDGQGNASIFI